MDRLSAMYTFVRVVETGSFSAAAREAGATQSAISKQIAALEATLGARLLSRTTRALALTEEGERYFEHVRRLVAEVAEAESDLRRGAGQLRGWLRVAASVAFGRLKLLPLVHSFMREHRDVKIDLRLDDGFIDLIEQGIDIAVRIGDLADSTLLARRIGTTRRVVVASAEYLDRLPAGSTAPHSPDDLVAHPCIVYTELSAPNDWRFTAGPGAAAPAGTTRIVRVHGSLQTNSSEVARAAVISGMGIGYSPTWLFDAEFASGEVKALLPHWPAAQLPINLVIPPQRRGSAKVKAFADHLSAAAKLSASLID